MIESSKNRLIERMMGSAIRRMLKRHFHTVRVGGLEHIANLDPALPLVITPNHSCWWDGLLAFFLSRNVLHLDTYLMMEERQMERYRFFRWIGAFSVIRENPREAVKSLRYAAALLDRPGRAVWMYPQGIMLANASRPLSLYHGVGRLATMLDDLYIVPAAHCYEFLLEQRPEAFTLFGPPLRTSQPSSHRDITAILTERMTELHDTLRCCIADGQLDGFTTVLHGRPSTNRLYDSVRGIRT